jgi:hypothetical protein
MVSRLLRVLAGAAVAFAGLISSAPGAEDALFSPWKYPPGRMYRADDLPGLVGRPIQKPAYLVGDFLYLGKVDGKESFRTFTSPPLRLGNIVLFVKLHYNFPPTLVPGRAVRPDRREPIALLEVKRGTNGELIAYGEDIVRPTVSTDRP